MNILKSVFFYPMMLMRRIMISAGHFIAGFFLLILVIFGLVKYIGTEFLTWWEITFYGFCALAFHAITILYDRILEWLNPTGEPLNLDD